jgi:hypothetical protein
LIIRFAIIQWQWRNLWGLDVGGSEFSHLEKRIESPAQAPVGMTQKTKMAYL